MNIQAVYKTKAIQALLIKRRQARARFFLSKVETYPGMSILDVGCGVDGNSLECALPPAARVVGIDLLDPSMVKISHPHFLYFQQDAVDLSRFHDNQFDLAVSVGMMEHVCDFKKLYRIADEMLRVSKQTVIVVPWKFAWIEPHFKLPFFQLLPWPIQLALVKMFDCQRMRAGATRDPNKFHALFLRQYQWLSTQAWKAIFHANRAYVTPTLETIAVVRGPALVPTV